MKLLVPLTALLLVACGANTTNSPDGSPAGFTDQLLGTWASVSCTNFGTASMPFYGRLSFNYQRATFTITGTFYADAACSTALMRTEKSGPLQVVGPSASVAGAYEVNYPTSRLMLTPLSPMMVDAFNAMQCGGRAGWTLNMAGDVTQAGCPMLGVQGTSTCAGEQDLNQISGSNLTFGDRSGNLCQMRPTRLGTLVVARQ